MLILQADHIRQILTIEEAITANKKAFLALEEGSVQAPERVHMDFREEKGTALFMPSGDVSNRLIGLKVANLFEKNYSINLPLLHSVMLLFDGVTGKPLAMLEGSTLTAARTAAGSAVATDLLANPSVENMAVFGAGVQGKAHIEAMCAVRTIKKVFVFDPNPDRIERLKNTVQTPKPVEIREAEDESVLKKCQLICTTTTARLPVFPAGSVAPGTHINAIGSYKPNIREIPGEVVHKARVVVDNIEAALREAGDLVIPLKEGLISRAHISLTVGRLLQNPSVGRQTPEEITLFKSVGSAAQDLHTAYAVYQQAIQTNTGIQIEF